MRSNTAFSESKFVSSHCIEIHGKKIKFDAIAEDYIIYDEDGNAEASLFSYTYLRSDVPSGASRPVLFVWDGGPGGSCINDHLSFFGPWRIKAAGNGDFFPTVPPYELEDNPHCILDVCDIVLLDPADTGYGRILNREKVSKYASSVGDTAATADFIESWLSYYDRWNCPIFLSGTSYGTVRCARVVEELNGGAFHKNGRQRSIAVSGMVLTGGATWMPTEGIAIDDNSASSLLPDGTFASVLLFPSLAAANWYHSPELQNESLDDFCERSWKWSWERYEPYISGAVKYDDAALSDLANEMSSFIGIDTETLLDMDLKIEQSEVYAAMRLSNQGRDLGTYDSRMTLEQNQMIGVADPASDDPAMSVYSVPQVAVMNALLKKKLGIDFDRHYIDVNYSINAVWDYSAPEMIVPQIPTRTHRQCLAAAMRRNESMKMIFSNGAFDMVTWSGLNRYVAENSGLPQDRTFFKRYPAGHAAYIGEKAATLFEKDLREIFFNF